MPVDLDHLLDHSCFRDLSEDQRNAIAEIATVVCFPEGHVLFDTGQTVAVLCHNLALLDLKPQDADALVLSHAHYDHTGWLEALLSKNTDLSLYAHTDIFQPRYSLRKGEYQSIGLSLTQENVSNRVKLRLSVAPTEILPGLWTTGEISERSEPEGRNIHHFIRTTESWQPDS